MNSSIEATRGTRFVILSQDHTEKNVFLSFPQTFARVDSNPVKCLGVEVLQSISRAMVPNSGVGFVDEFIPFG